MRVENYANWTVCYDVPTAGSLAGGGLVIGNAQFAGRGVLREATQPFTLVPYHEGGADFKDGLGGLNPYTPLPFDAPNKGRLQGTTDLSQIVSVEHLSPTAVEPARLSIKAKFQAGSQYIQAWEFRGDGSIVAGVGLGGAPLGGSYAQVSLFYNFYFRLDFDLGSGGNQVVEQRIHALNKDTWQSITGEGSRLVVPGQYTRWRICDLGRTNAAGLFNSYEIVPGTPDPPDGQVSTADLWVVARKGPDTDMGAEIEFRDSYLGAGYGRGGSVVGKDVIVWHALRAHHRPRSEESLVMPYHFYHFTLRPRDFLDGTPTGLYATNPPSP